MIKQLRVLAGFAEDWSLLPAPALSGSQLSVTPAAEDVLVFLLITCVHAHTGRGGKD